MKSKSWLIGGGVVAAIAISLLLQARYDEVDSSGAEAGPSRPSPSAAGSAPVAAPSVTDLASGFRIVEWHVDPPNVIGSIYVRGEVRNNNSVAAGVALQVIVRDAAGRVVDSATFWPASIRNIAPGASEPIGYPATDSPDAVTFELRIVDAKTR